MLTVLDPSRTRQPAGRPHSHRAVLLMGFAGAHRRSELTALIWDRAQLVMAG